MHHRVRRQSGVWWGEKELFWNLDCHSLTDTRFDRKCDIFPNQTFSEINLEDNGWPLEPFVKLVSCRWKDTRRKKRAGRIKESRRLVKTAVVTINEYLLFSQQLLQWKWTRRRKMRCPNRPRNSPLSESVILNWFSQKCAIFPTKIPHQVSPTTFVLQATSITYWFSRNFLKQSYELLWL